VTSSSGTLGK
jgi:SepF-like predicted cell division protein (DUF552 family)